MEDKNKEKNREGDSERLSGLLMGLMLGFTWGPFIKSCIYEPPIFRRVSSVNIIDENNDGLQDIVINEGKNRSQTYFGTKDGKYLTADQIKQSELERIEQGYQKQLRETNEYFKRAYSEPNLVGDR
ncbi:MAG: hypothetical protein ACP5OG_00125 [Candidatus Nanoarchaeia archaeon]